jgi:hypothetical protein
MSLSFRGESILRNAESFFPPLGFSPEGGVFSRGNDIPPESSGEICAGQYSRFIIMKRPQARSMS